MQNLIDWCRVKGKFLLLYLLIIYLIVSPFIKQFSVVGEYLPDDKYGIPAIGACLYLMVQIFMAMFKSDDKEVSLRKFEDISENFKKRLNKAKQVDILCSSSETFYPILKEVFFNQRIRCRMLLRHPLKGNEKQIKEIQHYIDSYVEITEENKEFNFSLKFCDNTFSRIIIIDNAEAYFGFYRVDNGRLRANDFEMIHAKSGSYFGNFVINIARNRFESVWNIADDELKEREKLVY